jgi:hypothetical protein
MAETSIIWPKSEIPIYKPRRVGGPFRGAKPTGLCTVGLYTGHVVTGAEVGAKVFSPLLLPLRIFNY